MVSIIIFWMVIFNTGIRTLSQRVKLFFVLFVLFSISATTLLDVPAIVPTILSEDVETPSQL